MSEHRAAQALDVLAGARKAVTAAVTSGLTALLAVVSDGVTVEEWIIVALAVVAPGGATYAVTNRPKGS